MPRKNTSAVVSETIWREFEDLCGRNGLSVSKGVSLAVYEWLVNNSGKKVYVPKELAHEFLEETAARKRARGE